MKKTVVIFSWFLLYVLFSAFFCSYRLYAMNREEIQETVDLVLAVVNDEIITLTDLRIFSIVAKVHYDKIQNERNELGSYLEPLIDQKLVLQMTNEGREITDADIQRFKSKIEESDNRDRFNEELSSLGLVYEDIHVYVEEILLFERIITQRFNQAAAVSLSEIELYYQKTYLPRQQSEGLSPKPIVDILDEIETAIKKEKIDKQVKEWIAKLKEAADIEIKNNEAFFKNEKNERKEYD
ncbi:MAG: hypothetical protein JW755_03445 [Candidatus Aminicenantes bacterium]|nr:hypothetical protein [Candidatus Aminicenantes bacterium]